MKKTNLTNSLFQSRVLPIIQVAETRIKKLVLYYALSMKPLYELNNKVRVLIEEVDYRLPNTLIDKDNYVNGLYEVYKKLIKEVYKPIYDNFILISLAILLKPKFKDRYVIKTPIELIKKLKTDKEFAREFADSGKGEKLTGYKLDMRYERKGYPYIKDYPQLLKERIKDMAKTQTTSVGGTTTGMSLWQKAELDLRHEKQMDMINELKTKGVKLAWTSSHPDCSKRCEPWQGKLFDLQAMHSDLSNHRMNYKVDGNTVYCFEEVIHQQQKTKSGKVYENNIIVGFNCRHKLIEYEPGSVPPKQFSKKDVKEQRKINLKLRELERKIRYLKQQVILYNSIDKQRAMLIQRQVDRLVAYYKKFANDNGYSWYEYRIKV